MQELNEVLAIARENYFELEEYKNIDSDIRYARFYREKLKAELSLKYRNVDVGAAILDAEREIQRLTDSIARLQGQQHWLQLESLRCASSLQELEEILHKAVLHIGKDTDPRDYLFRTSPNLALAIHNRIASAQAVLVIVYRNSAYRTWLEFEYQTAFALGKPLVGILRDDITDYLPADLKRFGMRPVHWNCQEIHEILKEICEAPNTKQPQKETSSETAL